MLALTILADKGRASFTQEFRDDPFVVLGICNAILVLAGDFVESVDPRRHGKSVLSRNSRSADQIERATRRYSRQLLQVFLPKADDIWKRNDTLELAFSAQRVIHALARAHVKL